MNDPIVAEVRKVRREHAEAFGNDLKAMFDDLVNLQNQHKEKLVRMEPKRISNHPPNRTK